MQRFAVFALAALAVLALAPRALAQIDDIPCLFPRTIDDPSGTTGGLSSFRVQTGSRRPANEPSSAVAAEDEAAEDEAAIRLVAYEKHAGTRSECEPYFQIRFNEWIGHFNEYDGVSTTAIDVAVQSVGLSHVGPAWRWGVTLPYVNWSTSSPDMSESGFGDTFGVAVRSFKRAESAGGVDGWLDAKFGGSLPTGSESRHLGHGGPSITAGVTWRIGRDQPAACPEWLRPDWLVEIGLAPTWTHAHFDTTTLDFGATIKTAWGAEERAVPVLTAGVGVVAELGEGMRHVAGADAVTQADAILQLAWVWDPFTVAVGTRIPLNDDGLRGDPTVDFTLAFRPQLAGLPAPASPRQATVAPQRSSGL